MTAPMLACLVLALLMATSWAGGGTVAVVTRHPKFSAKQQFGFVDSGLWSASFTTSVRGLDADWMGALALPQALQLDIEHLPDRKAFQLDLDIECEPAGKWVKVQHILPFKFLADRTFCEASYPFRIRTQQSEWATSEGQPKYSLILGMGRVPGGNLPFNETFSKRIRVKFTFYNAHWRLESNSLYLWSWDSVFKREKQSRSRSLHFLTQEAFNLMQGATLAGAEPFGSLRFFDQRLMSLISSAPQYVQSYASVGAIMLLGVGFARACDHPRSEFTRNFATRKAGVTPEHDSMLKVAQVTPDGTLVYSRYGLSAAMTKFLAENRRYHQQSPHEPESYRLRICVWVELSHPRPPVHSIRTVELITNPKLSHQTYGKATNGCQIVGSSRRTVTLFARSGYNRLTCPIICSNEGQPYLFYKGTLPLTPDSTKDATTYLNESIFAYKAGTMIELRNDLTHEDAGEYSCTAGVQTVWFEVNVVNMPYFSMRLLSGKTLIGSLPTRMYAIEGEGYSVSCKVYFTGILNPSLVPLFYLQSADGQLQWTQNSAMKFLAEANADDPYCRAEVVESGSSSSRTVTLIVRGVRREGRPRRSLFDHRMVCQASSAAVDAERYGLADYSLQSGSDVHFVPRPGPDSFTAKWSQCCLKASCTAQCSVEIALKKELHEFFNTIGLKVEATFRQNFRPLESFAATYDAKLVKATIRLPGSLCSLSEAQRRAFLAIRPVFRYTQGIDITKEANSFTVLRGLESDTARDKACLESSGCLFSTDFDHRVSAALNLRNLLSGGLQELKKLGNITSQCYSNLAD